ESGGGSLSAGDQQVEQDRAPDVLVYQYELERRTLGQLRDGGEPDQRHHHATRATREGSVRQTPVRNRGQNQRRADERPEYPTPQPKPRVELFDLSSQPLKESNGKLYFAAIPKLHFLKSGSASRAETTRTNVE